MAMTVTKKQLIDDPNSCLNKAADDEPVFLIRAKDMIGGMSVRYWAHLAQDTKAHEPAKIAQARHVASEMDEWRNANEPKPQ